MGPSEVIASGPAIFGSQSSDPGLLTLRSEKELPCEAHTQYGGVSLISTEYVVTS